jgi:hypothetical protein
MADNTNRVAGVATLTVDGQSYALRGQFGYRVSKVNRSTIAGQDDIHGYKEMPVQGHIKCQLTDTHGLSVSSLNAMTNVTVVAELANGKVIVGRNMWTVDAQDVDTVEAIVEVMWESADVSEQPAQG